MTAPIIPTSEPAELRAGLTWVWKKSLSDYPATTWTLTYWFKQMGVSGTNFSVVASADGMDYSVTVTAATTANYTADDYSWVAVASSGTESYEVDRGTLKVLPKYNAVAALDDRSHARKVLEAIEAVIENRATKDQEEYSFSNRSLKRTPLPDLIKLRDKYRAEVYAEEASERAANGKKTSTMQWVL